MISSGQFFFTCFQIKFSGWLGGGERVGVIGGKKAKKAQNDKKICGTYLKNHTSYDCNL